MKVKLLVIRSKDIKQLADFYSLLGMTFNYHQHGNSPFHFSAAINETVLEIYPLTKSQTEADKNLRLGFAIENFETVIIKLKEINVPFAMEPTNTDFGFMAIIVDPDGRKIELYK